MTIALVQQAQASQGTGTSLPITISAPAAGNALILICGQNSAFVSSVSGGGVTWTLLKRSAFNFYAAEIWYGENSSGSGTTVTITLAGSTRCAALVAEFSGIKTTGSADASVVEANGNSTSASPGAIDPSANPALYLAGAACQNSTFTGVVGGGFTQFTDPTPGGGALSVQGAYLIDNAGDAAATPTFGILAAAAWDAAGGALQGVATVVERPPAQRPPMAALQGVARAGSW